MEIDYELLCGFLQRCLGIITGCRRAFAKASAEYCELPSVLITLPIDMKKLELDQQKNANISI